MKKILYFLPALFFLAGCSDDNEFAQLPEQGEHYLANTPEVVRASVASSGEAQSRAFVDGQNILWHKGDAISYFGGDAHNSQYVFNGENGTAKADFERKSANVNPNAENLYSHAVYPYSSHITSVNRDGVYEVSVNFPTLQTYAPNSFGREANIMVAAGSSSADEELFFRNACGYLVVNLYGSELFKVRTVELESIDENVKLSGQGSISIVQNGDPTVKMSNSSYAINMATLDCSNVGGVALGADAAHATAFWFALPPVKMEKGFRMTVTDMDGNVFKTETQNPVEITRNEVQPMQAIRYVPPTHILKYKTHDGEIWDFNKDQPFDAEILSHKYNKETGYFEIITKTPLTVIKKEAFEDRHLVDYHYTITSVIFPEGLTTIESGAFEECDFKDLVIPGSVTFIGTNAFMNCYQLKNVTFLPNPSDIPLEIEPRTADTRDIGSPFGTSYLRSLHIDRDFNYVHKGKPYIPDDTTSGLFASETHSSNTLYTTKVTIGSQLKEIYPYMFARAPITELEIPNTITKIGESAFEDCTKFQSIRIAGSVTSIGNFAFDNCKSLSSVIFEKGSEPLIIGFQPHVDQKGPFFDSPMTYIYVDRDLRPTSEYAAAMDEWDEGIFAYDYWNDDDISTKVSLQSGMRTIYPYMFSGVRMTGCWIPNEVTSIGDEAFDDCEQLEYLTMGSPNPPTLGKDVFDDCEVLTNIVVPAGSISNYKNHSQWSSWGFNFMEWK